MAYNFVVLHLELAKIEQQLEQCLDITYLAEQMILNLSRARLSNLEERQILHINTVKAELIIMKRIVNSLIHNTRITCRFPSHNQKIPQ